MTQQEAFNKNWQHFVVNKQPASYDIKVGACLYRGPNNTKCGVGLLIEDKDYNSEWEEGPTGQGYGVRYLSGNNLLPAYLKDISLDFLASLQGAHDRAAMKRDDFTDDIEVNLRELAAEYLLTIPQ